MDSSSLELLTKTPTTSLLSKEEKEERGDLEENTTQQSQRPPERWVAEMKMLELL